MRIDLANFRGSIPRVTARNLPETHAAMAINCEFERTTLAPVRKAGLVETLNANASTFYRFGETWLGWAGHVSVARAPIAANRIYYTGDGAPKVRDNGIVYNLALPAPETPPTVTNLTSPDPDNLETILYVYTYVTSLGEESAPSPPSEALDWSPGVVNQIAGFETVPGGRAITHRRIYRSQTSAAGVTGFYFAKQIPIATTSTTYNIAANPLKEPLQTQDYDTPAAGLSGLTAMPNGMMAAFAGKAVYFCEPWQPHAWPRKYMLTVDWDVVGLACFGDNLAILTTGSPYIAQGLSPDTMAMVKMETGVPCLSRRGIVDVGYAAVYPAPEGLALISQTETRILTQGVFTTGQWQAMEPDTFIAERHKGRYLFCYEEGARDVIYGGNADGWDTPPAVDTIYGGNAGGWSGDMAPLHGGNAFSTFGGRQFASIDLTADPPDFTRINLATPAAMWRDETTNNLYFLGDDNRSIFLWSDPARPNARFRWRSKLFSSVSPISFGALFARTERPLLSEDEFEVRVFANDAQIASITRANRIARLPAGRMAEEWQVEILANVPVVSVQVAGTIDELLGAG
jgi:hypothetical protein